MAKEKNFNPVQAAKKAEKQKQIKKQKAQVQAQRTEKLARRNPSRIQRDIDALKEAEQNGSLRPHEKQRLSELEKDLVAVNKARSALGDKAPFFRSERRDDGGNQSGHITGNGPGSIPRKRMRDGSWKERRKDDSSDTDADAKDIPMPRDTPPPISQRQNQTSESEEVPLEPKKPTLVYEAAPQLRDLRKETTKFMPTVVAQKMRLAKGETRLLEPEEFDKLQKEGYIGTKQEDKVADNDERSRFLLEQSAKVAAEKVVEAAVEEAQYKIMEADAEGKMNDTEAERSTAENKLRHVEIEEVVDEDI